MRGSPFIRNEIMMKMQQKPMLGEIPSLTAKSSPNFVFGYQFITPRPNFLTEELNTENMQISYVTLKKIRAKSHEKAINTRQEEFIHKADTDEELLDIEFVKKRLNEKAEEQKLTLSSKATEETDKPSIVISKQRSTEGTNATINKNANDYRNITLNDKKAMKLLNREIVDLNHKHDAEILELKSELENTKQHLHDNEKLIQQLKNLSIWISKQLEEYKEDMKRVINKVKEMITTNDNFEKSNQEKLVHVINYAVQIASIINNIKLDELVNNFNLFNEVTTCYNCKDTINVSSQTSEELEENKKMKLAKILSLISLRNKASQIQRSLVHDKTEESNLLNKLKVAIQAKEHHLNENEILKKQMELLRIKIEKESRLSTLLSKQLKEQEESFKDKLIQEAYNKDMAFLSKMKEMKNVFNEMVREKKKKQEEIENLQKRNSMLESSLIEFKEIEQAKSRLNESALVLASIVLAQSNESPKPTPKNLQLFTNAFEDQVKELLNKIASYKQREEILREEVRRGIIGREILKSIITVNEIIINRTNL